MPHYPSTFAHGHRLLKDLQRDLAYIQKVIFTYIYCASIEKGKLFNLTIWNYVTFYGLYLVIGYSEEESMWCDGETTVYSNLLEATNACNHDVYCHAFYDISCDGKNGVRTCSLAQIKGAAKGSCLYSRGKDYIEILVCIYMRN